MSHKKKLLFGVAAVVLLCAIGWLAFFRFGEQRLSESEISKLREKYPVCGDIRTLPPNGDLLVPTWEKVKAREDTFIYCTIGGDMTTYDQYISTGNPELDKKRQENGIGDVYKFYEYPITVIEDAAGLFQPGDKLTIASNMDFVDYKPHLSKGMKAIVPVIRDMDVESRMQFGVNGFFYVTEDGYVLSAFDEQKASIKTTITGEKVDVLLKELKQAMKERAAVAPQAEREDGEQFS